MKHLQDQDLQLYLDQQLRDREKIDHLRHCPLCQERLDTYEIVFSGLRQAPQWTPSPQLQDKVMQKIKPDPAGSVYQQLLQVLAGIGMFIGALSFSLPYLHADNYLESIKKIQAPSLKPDFSLLEKFNFLPSLKSMTGDFNFNYSLLIIAAGVLLLAALMDHLIGLARGRTASQR